MPYNYQSVSVIFGGTDLTSAATSPTKMVVSSVARPSRKPMTKRRLKVPGRAGSWDFGPGVPEDYQVTVLLHVIGETPADSMATAAALSVILDGKKPLVISDQPLITHQAQVYDEVRIEPEPGKARAFTLTVIFECDA